MASAVNKIIFYISNKVIKTAFVILTHFHELQPEQKLIMNVEKKYRTYLNIIFTVIQLLLARIYDTQQYLP